MKNECAEFSDLSHLFPLSGTAQKEYTSELRKYAISLLVAMLFGKFHINRLGVRPVYIDGCEFSFIEFFK